MIDSKVEEIGRALTGLSDIGLDKDVADLSGGQRTKVLLGKLFTWKTWYLTIGWAYQLPRYRAYWMAETLPEWILKMLLFWYLTILPFWIV